MKCPGQDTQYWTAGAIFEVPCPGCGAIVEFFKDDTSRRCRQCGHRFINPNLDFGCAAYCPFAEQCLGDLPPELVAQKEDLLKDRVAVAVKRHFKTDFKAIGRAARRARHAEEIGRNEQVNLAAVLMASYLWEVGGGADAEKIPAARAILSDLKAPEPLIGRVCELLVRDPDPAGGDTAAPEVKVLLDANALMDVEEKNKNEKMDRQVLQQWIDQTCLTQAGRNLAAKILL